MNRFGSLILFLFLATLAWPTTKPEVILRMAEIHPDEHPTARGSREFARRVFELTRGRIRVDVYSGGYLGEELPVLEQIRFGGIDLARVSSAHLIPSVPRLTALAVPYLYRDHEQMWKVLTGPIGTELLADLDQAGYVGIGWFDAGVRHFYTVKAPIKQVNDLKGLRIRVQESPVMIAMAAAFGATPVPLTYGEVYRALRTGVIDGAENNLPSYYSTGHYQAAPFVILDGHTRIPEIILGSPVSFRTISAADRMLIRQAADEAQVYQRKEWAAHEKEITQKLVAEGVKIEAFHEREPWAQKAKAIIAGQSEPVREMIARIQAVR